MLPIEIKELALSEDYVTEEYDTSADLSAKLLKEVEKKGWTFDYNFMGEIYSLRPIGEPEQEFSKGGRDLGAKVGKLLKTFEKELKSNGFDFARYPNPNGYLLLVDDLKERSPYEIEETINSISSKLGVSDQVLLPQVTKSIGFKIVYDTDKSYAEGGEILNELPKYIVKGKQLMKHNKYLHNNVVVEVEEVDEWVLTTY